MFDFRRIPSLFRLSALDDGTAQVSSWNRAERLPLDTPAVGEMIHAAGPCKCGIAHPAGVYNEEAFQYLLALEYKRFARSHRPFVLALISQASVPEPAPMSPATTTNVFGALAHALRETDVIGWYREHHVIGALLTHVGDAPLPEVSRIMSKKITAALKDRPGVSDRRVDRLDVKVYHPFGESWS